MKFLQQLERSLRHQLAKEGASIFMRTKYFSLSMSPPPKQICVDHLVSDIGDLDTVELEKNKDKKLKAVPAKEHDDVCPQANMSEGVQENGVAGKCVELPMDDVKRDADKFEFLPADSSTTPSSLCAKSNPSDDHHKSSGNFCDSSEASVGEVKLQISDTQSLSQKRKKKIKENSKEQTSKRCRTSLNSYVRGSSYVQNGSCLNVGKTPGVKTVGGGTQPNQTGNGGSPAEASNTNGTATTAGMQGNACGNRGGGGGGGGGDENNPPRELKQLDCDRPSTPINYRKQKNSADMDIDGSNSPSRDSGMDIAGSPPTGSDAQMVSVSQQVARPEQKPPEENKVLVDYHCGILHLVLHNDMDHCQRCHMMNKVVAHVFAKDACMCPYCKVWPTALKFHQERCKYAKRCHVCVKAKPIPVPTVQPVPLIIPQTVLNVPTSGTSLDQEEAVIYCDDSLQYARLSRVKEHVDYSFKYQDPKKIVGKGGHGTVHDIVLHGAFEEMFLGFPPQDVVVKKTTLGYDEKEVLKATACHPNFVKTYLVVNKTDIFKIGANLKECMHRIFMPKCDMSLKEYIDKKWKKGEVLDKYEAMHYWAQVLDAVVHLHTWHTPIIHKDIKPGNVLLTFETNLVRVMLADFDAVRLLYNEYTEPGLPPQGTENYIAPEVRYSQVHGRPADVYSMGKFLLELMCRKEWKNTELALKKLKEMDYDLGVLIEQCLEINPYDRPTAIEIRDSEAVKKYLSSSDVSMSQPGKA